MTRLTVCIPVYNHPEWFAASLASVFAQTYQDFTVVVRDDCSTDDIHGAMQQLIRASSWPEDRISYYRNERNLGSMANTKRLIFDCQTELFFPFAADDVLSPTALEKLVAAFDEDPGLEFAAVQTRTFIDAEGKQVGPDDPHPFLSIPPATNRTQEDWLRVFYQTNLYFGPGMYRTATLVELGGWDQDMRYIADLDMYVRLVKRHAIRVIEEDLCATRIHSDNYSLVSGEGVFALRRNYGEIRRRHFNHPVSATAKLFIAEIPKCSEKNSNFCIFHLRELLTAIGWSTQHFTCDMVDINQALNRAMAEFYESDCTHVLFVDGNSKFQPSDALRVLLLPDAVVGAAGMVGGAWNIKLHTEDGISIGRTLPDGKPLLLSDTVNVAFLRMTREAVTRFIKSVWRDSYFDPVRSFSDTGMEQWPFFQSYQRGNYWINASQHFSERARQIGLELWIEPNVTIDKANLAAYLREIYNQQCDKAA